MKIILYGESGVGKSTIAKSLSNYFNLKKVSLGDVMREEAKKLNLSIYEFDKLCVENSKYDIEIDKKIAEIGNTQDNIILDGRLVWYFVNSGIKIKLVCDYDEVLKRISQRESISIDEANRKTQSRQNNYVTRYAKIYPHIEYPPKNDEFDIVYDTTNKTLEESTKDLIEKIKQIKN